MVGDVLEAEPEAGEKRLVYYGTPVALATELATVAQVRPGCWGLQLNVHG